MLPMSRRQRRGAPSQPATIDRPVASMTTRRASARPAVGHDRRYAARPASRLRASSIAEAGEREAPPIALPAPRASGTAAPCERQAEAHAGRCAATRSRPARAVAASTGTAHCRHRQQPAGRRRSRSSRARPSVARCSAARSGPVRHRSAAGRRAGRQRSKPGRRWNGDRGAEEAQRDREPAAAGSMLRAAEEGAGRQWPRALACVMAAAAQPQAGTSPASPATPSGRPAALWPARGRAVAGRGRGGRSPPRRRVRAGAKRAGRRSRRRISTSSRAGGARPRTSMCSRPVRRAGAAPWS